jgi:hypothetical protein
MNYKRFALAGALSLLLAPGPAARAQEASTTVCPADTGAALVNPDMGWTMHFYSNMSIHWWPRVELAENRGLIQRINLRLGYRLQLRRLSWPREVPLGKPFRVTSVWANAGVAPCYPGGFVTLTLKDDQAGIGSVLADEQFNVRDLVPGPPEAAPARTNDCRFTIGRFAPVTKPGQYALFVSVGLRDGTPRIALPLADDDGQHRYRLGQITLREE